ncbi:Mus7/MMS22 family-domain-containing protein [Microdochium trichocladiopsis]|uniref:Mus7/MMS22 family-domain-containing protein n=1 Tax=Microdochium trichocladiopsis TaxID=1682393 RepID=A0A9P8XVU4_9PEZI|nr:Mus7/MMS22 family-domain-containing protein [Microdochium trichocladiopsis]KAH7021108.1 Mus7/MMS22 family-domain-containing protein [Microdochium trichocladiopsis]
MATWKELGEVPDSDDEDALDAEDSQRSLPTAILDPPNDATRTIDEHVAHDSDDNDDIWRVPTSLSQERSGFEKSVPIEKRRAASPTHLAPVEIPSSPLSELPGEEFDELVRDHESSIVQTNDKPGGHEQSTSQPLIRGESLSTPLDAEGFQDFEYSTQAFGYGTRSLRPRKPIQEHPYLLENAQYSKLFKSHGMRPMRIVLEEQHVQPEEKDSQEQDYEDESQQSGRNDSSTRLDESQPTDLYDIFADGDDLDLSPLEDNSMSSDKATPTRHASNGVIAEADDDDDDLPDAADIGKWKPRKRAKLNTQSTPQSVAKRARLKLPGSLKMPRAKSSSMHPIGVFDVPPSPPDTSPGLQSTTPRARLGLARRTQTLTPRASSTIDSSRPQSPAPGRLSNFVIDLSGYTTNSARSDGEVEGGTSASGSDSEPHADVVETVGKRIRGVLPASWLRLDQKRAKPSPHRRMPLQRSPGKSPRKGVAQRRVVSGTGAANPEIFFDDSDESHDETTSRFNDNISEQRPEIADDGAPVFEDDAGSVVEDDQIDLILPGSKGWSLAEHDITSEKKTRKTLSSVRGESGRNMKQTKISGHVTSRKQKKGSSLEARPGRATSTRQHRKKHESGQAKAKTKTARSTPRLSVLDVIEPDAPSFLRIAARTARRRVDKGRASPSQKIINLGVRKDNIDAVKALVAWRSGSIRPRASVTSLATKRTGSPIPLQPMSDNIMQPMSEDYDARQRQDLLAAQFSGPRRQIHLARMAESLQESGQNSGGVQKMRAQQSFGKSTAVEKHAKAHVRPAMLETPSGSTGHRAFHSTKRALDAVFRRTHKGTPSLVSTLETKLDRAGNTSQSTLELHAPMEASPTRPERPIQRRRKQAQPTWVDTAAPKYLRASDPVLVDSDLDTTPIQREIESGSSGKLLGLGAFGTLYTHHFEIFPLDPGAFFHQDTLIGSGRLARALGLQMSSQLSPRDRTFVLGEKVLHWSSWTSEVSSEFGILFDWVLDQAANVRVLTSFRSPAANGLYFALDFMQDSLDFSAPDTSFFTRFCDVLQTFTQQIESLLALERPDRSTFIDILSLCLVLLSQALCSARRLDLMAVAYRVEDVLTKLSKITLRCLLESELSEVRHLYDKLQSSSFREVGIRNEHAAVIGWVCVMHILQMARIPRSGFWDILGSLMLGTEMQSSYDSVKFEKIWQTMFMLLPLSEFDGNGVLVVGLRKSLPFEGWAIPQKLLSRVFAIYKANQQQAASFNDYCRAILGRCHYLAEQWGWRRANTIAGVIFDFFASQGLAHLRHEEAYTSPQFLEELATCPSLSVTASDRCFHIFLKVVALTIRGFVETGSVKDIRNLVARVMPNHDRQFSKEMDMHQSDLAALRNHHDLLCTLFWAAPVDCRPSAQMIERLVQPESSHKEACLVNLRSWSQLSRFVTNEHRDASAYRPFAAWIRNITQQLMQQYRSAEDDAKQQFATMSTEASRNISQDFLDIVISTNKKAALESLGASMSTVLNTMQHVPSLNLATLVFSNYPLELVFAEMQCPTTDSAWRCLHLGLDLVDCYLSLITNFSSPSYATSSSNEQWHTEEALEFLERVVVKYFFRTARSALAQDVSQSTTATQTQLNCLERLVAVGGRLGARLCQARLADISTFFGSGRFSTFPGPHESSAKESRKYLSLFLATIISNEITDFKALKPSSSMLGILLHAIVKPSKFLQYENRLSAAIQSTGSPYLRRIVVRDELVPGYSSNRDLFSTITQNMRRALQDAEPSRRLVMKSDFAMIMKSVMEQLKADLRLMTLDSRQQHAYIEFVRMIINLIRAQDFCPVDQFFYQISPEFTPSSQDPRLQAAGILSYGLKLEENDPRAAPGLFYLLLANFKIALANGRVAEERSIVQQGLDNLCIFRFMLGHMLPALVMTAAKAGEAWILLETYAQALCESLSAPAIHRHFGKEDMPAVLALYTAALDAFLQMARMDISDLRGEHLHSLTMIFMALNAFGPSVVVHFMMEDNELDIEPDESLRLRSIISSISGFVTSAASHLDGVIRGSHEANGADNMAIVPDHLFEGLDLWNSALPPGTETQVDDFSRHVTDDISRNWVSTGSTMTVRGPTRLQGLTSTQSGRGIAVPQWDRSELVSGLVEQLQGWIANYGGSCRPAKDFEKELWW